LESAIAPDAPAAGQQAPAAQAVETTPTVIKTESALVLVDVIATDKKGRYITDLQQSDFHVFEDDKEQTIASFSRESDAPNGSPEHQRYMVLFFDDSTMGPTLQVQARKDAAKFVEGVASPNHQIAVVDFDGSLRIAQNFTADGEMLKRAVSSVKFAGVNPNAGSGSAQLAALGAPSLRRTESDFAARSVLLSMRELAKSLGPTAGRKTLIMFSAGFPLTPERQSELTATIDALNKANIAVYPVDVRGLTGDQGSGIDVSKPSGPPVGFGPGTELRGTESPFVHLPGLLAALAFPFPDPLQGGHAGGAGGGGTGGAGGGGIGGGGGAGGGAGGGGGAGHGGGGSGGGTGSGGAGSGGGAGHGGGTTGSGGGAGGNRGGNPNAGGSNMTNCLNSQGGVGCRSREIIPEIPDSVSTNQQVLYALAKGTGGFQIVNTNDFLQGLNKIAKEMDEYYNLGYAPPSQVHDGSYHRIRIKVERTGVDIRYRTGYYDIKSPDLLRGTPEGNALEARIDSPQAGEIPVSVSTPYFYVEPGVARVNLAMSVPGSAIDFEKRKGVFHSDVHVLGIAYRLNGSIAARFSDTVKLDYQKNEVKDLGKRSFDYQNTFKIVPGSYTLKLVLSAGGEKFGKYEVPFYVQPFTGANLSLAGPALGEKFVPTSQLAAQMDAALMEDRTPLMFKDMELVPSTSYRFAQKSPPMVYVEVYEPELKGGLVPRVGLLFDIVDRKTNKSAYSSNTILINDFIQPGNPLVPFGFKLPVEQLQAGDYRVDIKARDDEGNVSTMRSADFSIQ